MKKIVVLTAAAFALTAFSLLTTNWKLDPPNSQLSFTVKHLGINEITGYFTDVDVHIQSAKPDFSDAIVTMSAKTASINTMVAARDKHLRSADFFDAATFPEIKFVSRSIAPDGGNEYKLTGDLTMHGITKRITLEMEYNGLFQGKGGKQVAGLEFEGTVLRSDFNIGGSFMDNTISNKVSIKGNGEFIRN